MMLRNLGARQIVHSGSLFLILMGFTAIVSWLFHWQTFLQPLPGTPFIAADTAVCLILAGLALFASSREALFWARMLAVTLTALGAAYLAAGIQHLWFSLHRLFPQGTTNVVSPLHVQAIGMAVATAAMFVLLGIALLLMNGRSRQSKYHLNAAAVIATGILALGLFSLSALLTEAESERPWTSLLLKMAAPTAVCACVVGVSTCALFWMKSRRTEQQLPATAAVLALLALLLLFAGVDSAIVANADAALRTRADLSRSSRQIQAIEGIVRSVRETETGQRGFLLTQDESYLHVYMLGLQEIRSGFQRLDPSSEGSRRVDALRVLIDRKLDEFAVTVDLERKHHHQDALVKSGQGLSLMAQIDSQAADIINRFQADFSERLRLNERSLRLMQKAAVISYLIALLLMGLALYLVQLEMRRRGRIEWELRRSETELEAKVAERTLELRYQAELLQDEISHRALTEQSLRETDDRFHLAVKFAKVAVWTWATEEDAIVWSGQVKDVFGVVAAQLSSYSVFRQLVLPQDRDFLDLRIAQAALKGADYSAEFRIVHPSGDVRWVAGLGGAVHDENGNLTHMTGVNFEVSDRKRAEQKLEVSEQYFRELAEAMPQIVWTATATGEFEYYNELWYTVTGLPQGTIASEQEQQHVTHPRDFELWMALWSNARQSGEPFEIEYRLCDVREKEYRWYLGRAVPVRDSKGSVVRWFGTATDIHQRKSFEVQLAENEQALRHREQQLAMIFETGSVGDWSWNIAKDELSAHPTVWALYGVPDENGPKPAAWFHERQHPLDQEMIARELQAALNGERNLDIEFRVVWPDCSVHWVACRAVVIRDQHGTPLVTQGLNIDITKRKIAEVQVQESERQFREQANAMPQIVWTSRPDGAVEHYNQRWYEYTGLSVDDPKGWGWPVVVHPDDLPACIDIVTRAIANSSGYEVELRLKRASDQTYRWHLARSVPYRDQEGTIQCWFGTSTDIHEQKAAKEHFKREVLNRTFELRESIEQFQAKEDELRRSLKEKETLLKEVHHRVKNNLQVISSLLRMHGDSLDDLQASAALKESQQRVLSMALIHERLYGNRQMDEIDFGEYTQTLVNELFYAYASKVNHVVTRLNLAHVLLNIDQAIPCGLILNELVTNALKYAYPNGQPGEVAVELKEIASAEVVLTVSDWGVGLPVGFDWKGSKSMGLPIVDILAKQIGGTLHVRSGPGTSFTVKFPKDTRRPKAASAA